MTLLQGDATTRSWWSGDPFERVLVDAPCSGTGTLRRHPDIKLLRRESDLDRYAKEAGDLLDNLWPLLRPGGVLVYCTCSLLTEENDAVIGAFLERQGDAAAEPITLPTGAGRKHGWQLFPVPAAAAPATGTVDGFYYARLTRREEAR